VEWMMDVKPHTQIWLNMEKEGEFVQVTSTRLLYAKLAITS
jgi:hypothetical protein